MVIWGDVAYTRDMFFSPDYWRKCFKPVVKSIVEECHSHGLPVIYHGCGNVRRIFQDFIDIGIDAYNPLEAKAGMDVVELRRQYGHRIGFCGNLDVVTWANGSQEEIKNNSTLPKGAAISFNRTTPYRATFPGRTTTTSYASCASMGGILCGWANTTSRTWGDET